VDASSSGFGNYFTSYGKFYDPFYGSITYNPTYADSGSGTLLQPGPHLLANGMGYFRNEEHRGETACR
jgi:hypothetical protein